LSVLLWLAAAVASWSVMRLHAQPMSWLPRFLP
jgi:hypothetical protein